MNLFLREFKRPGSRWRKKSKASHREIILSGAGTSNAISRFGATSAARATLEHCPARHAEREKKLAPDREHLNFGEDNNYEYKLYGYFSGEKVYEPASNTIYPEFVLEKYELISTHPPPIFKSQYSGRANAEATRFQIEKPE